jgi:DNA-binding transcriptional LysR family regulator
MSGVHIAHEELSEIDLNLLVVLDALLQESSVTRAAQRVGLSQSAVSHALKRLRELLGDPLLLRTSRGMVPTPRAQQLLAPVHQAVGQVQSVLAPCKPFDPLTSSHSFTLSMQDTGQAGLLPDLMRKVHREAPLVRLQIHPGIGGLRAIELESGSVDLTLAIDPALTQGFHGERVFDITYVSIVRTGHPKLDGPLTPEKFSQLSHVAVLRDGLVEPDLERVFAAHSLDLHLALVLPSLLPVPWVVARSDLIATVPETLLNLLPSDFPIERHKPPLPIDSTSVFLVWHERTHYDPAHQWLREVVKQTCLRSAPASLRAAAM